MTTDKELMQQALDALITAELDGNCEYVVTDALRARLAQPDATIDGMPAYEGPLSKSQRLAQPKPEPVAWWDAKLGVFDEKHFDQLQPLYTAPPQRKEWQGLTEEERYLNEARSAEEIEYARAIEAKLKEKNS